MIEIQTHYTAAIYRRYCWFNIFHRRTKVRILSLTLALLVIAPLSFTGNSGGLVQFVVTLLLAIIIIPFYR
ncbi:hypothetical protein ACFO26_04415 [Lactococcus nasutitermitis]|uniref:Uncharacterized protein n=1 Tax=Lactococcus nasutitermitis TaxID=1652957 RepID=A0ABV9JF88_9LACT|nr:hypothetical protein [Lactococcus nasutitermitis]